MDTIQTAVNDLLLNLALGVVSLLAGYAMYGIHMMVAKVKTQTEKLKSEKSRELLANAMSDVEHLAQLYVGAMEQTTAKALREEVKEGHATPGELKSLGHKVFDAVKAAVATESQQVIAKNLGDFDFFLTECIEDAVRKVKQEDPFASLPTAELVLE